MVAEYNGNEPVVAVPGNYGNRNLGNETWVTAVLWVCPEWRVLREPIVSILRAPLPFPAKAALLRVLLARMGRKRWSSRCENARVTRRLLRPSRPTGSRGPAQEE